MENLVSKVFEGLNIPFTGEHNQECADGVTYHDEGKMPLFLPSANLRYEFDFGFLEVKTGMEVSGQVNEVRASGDFMKFPERDVFDPRLDNLCLAVNMWIEDAHEELKLNHDLLERYIFFKNMNLFERAQYHKFISLFTEGYTKEQALALEEQLEDKFGISAYEDYHDDECTKLWLENNIIVDLQAYLECNLIIGASITAEKQEFLSVKDFIIGSDCLEGSNPRFIEKSDYLNKGHAWSITLPEEGNWILQEAFREDIKQLPVKKRF
jgi:hypothetical protein